MNKIGLPIKNQRYFIACFITVFCSLYPLKAQVLHDCSDSLWQGFDRQQVMQEMSRKPPGDTYYYMLTCNATRYTGWVKIIR